MMQRLTAAGYMLRAVCRFLGLPRSTAYYRAQADPGLAELKSAIASIAGQNPTYGIRRVTHELRRPPYKTVVNHKRVGRLMHQMGIAAHIKRKVYTTNSAHGYPRYANLVKDLAVTHPDQVWVSDITYIRLHSGFVYLAVIMDVYTRAIRGWHLSRTADQQLTLVALQRALSERVPWQCSPRLS
jgi:transposase InsO family protein